MDVRRIAIPAKLGLAILAAWPALTIGLSAVGERVVLIQAIAVLGLLPALLGAVIWLRAGQRSRKVYLRKRLFTVASLALALSVPLTHWPLWCIVKVSEKDLNLYTNKFKTEYTEKQIDENERYLCSHCGNPCMAYDSLFTKLIDMPSRVGALRSQYAIFRKGDDGDFLNIVLRSGSPEVRYSFSHRRWEIRP